MNSKEKQTFIDRIKEINKCLNAGEYDNLIDQTDIQPSHKIAIRLFPSILLYYLTKEATDKKINDNIAKEKS
jgi:hypothetical protein